MRRFVEAWEAVDVRALVSLLSDDALMTMPPEPMRLVGPEAIGTFWLTFGGCGSAVLAAAFPQVGIGLLGVSFAFGLTVLTMAYSIGHVSGCHLNPAVTLAFRVVGRVSTSDAVGYLTPGLPFTGTLDGVIDY